MPWPVEILPDPEEGDGLGSAVEEVAGAGAGESEDIAGAGGASLLGAVVDVGAGGGTYSLLLYEGGEGAM